MPLRRDACSGCWRKPLVPGLPDRSHTPSSCLCYTGPSWPPNLFSCLLLQRAKTAAMQITVICLVLPRTSSCAHSHKYFRPCCLAINGVKWKRFFSLSPSPQIENKSQYLRGWSDRCWETLDASESCRWICFVLLLLWKRRHWPLVPKEPQSYLLFPASFRLRAPVGGKGMMACAVCSSSSVEWMPSMPMGVGPL